MEDLGKNIKNRRKALKLTQEKLANILGYTSRSSISKIESGLADLTKDKIIDFANALETTPAYLMGWEDEKESNKNSNSILIPTYDKIQAGIPIENNEDIIDYEQIPIKMAKQGEYFGMQIVDDSMAPRFQKGDVVIVRKQSNIANDDIAIILVNGNDATMKKIKKDENGIALIPLNPNYQIRYYSNAEIVDLPVKCIGKVVELRGRF